MSPKSTIDNKIRSRNVRTIKDMGRQRIKVATKAKLNSSVRSKDLDDEKSREEGG